MTTLAQLATRAANDLGDAANSTWSAADLKAWIADAIRDYSNHYPRIHTATQACTTGQSSYQLPDDFLAAIRVEYPLDEEPPCYLIQTDDATPLWHTSTAYTTYAPDSDDPADAEITLSASPTTGQSFTVVYSASRAIPSADSDVLDIPPTSEYIILMFVRWKAYQQLLSIEQAAPTSSSSLMSAQFGENANRAEADYYAVIATVTRQEATPSNVTWRPFDAVY